MKTISEQLHGFAGDDGMHRHGEMANEELITGTEQPLSVTDGFMGDEHPHRRNVLSGQVRSVSQWIRGALNL